MLGISFSHLKNAELLLSNQDKTEQRIFRGDGSKKSKEIQAQIFKQPETERASQTRRGVMGMDSLPYQDKPMKPGSGIHPTPSSDFR
jgi:16S rRNA U516 pseudouridylate synthase RsuA-like enzyme